MKKVLTACVLMATLGLTACADHPYLSAGAAALGAAAIATAASNNAKHDHNKGTKEGWYDENGNFHRYQQDDNDYNNGRRHHKHYQQQQDEDYPVDDRPNWDR